MKHVTRLTSTAALIVLVAALGEAVAQDLRPQQNDLQVNNVLPEGGQELPCLDEPFGPAAILPPAGLPIDPNELVDLGVLADGMTEVHGGLLPDGEPPAPCRADDLDLRRFQALGPAYELIGPPRLEDYTNDGCLGDAGDHPTGWCDEDIIELTVEGNTLYALHKNAAYNCCPDDIVVTLIVEGNLLRLIEEETLTLPCYCICCYEVEATVVELAPGVYTVEYCWYDYDTGPECYVEETVIPGEDQF